MECRGEKTTLIEGLKELEHDEEMNSLSNILRQREWLSENTGFIKQTSNHNSECCNSKGCSK